MTSSPMAEEREALMKSPGSEMSMLPLPRTQSPNVKPKPKVKPKLKRAKSKHHRPLSPRTVCETLSLTPKGKDVPRSRDVLAEYLVEKYPGLDPDFTRGQNPPILENARLLVLRNLWERGPLSKLET